MYKHAAEFRRLTKDDADVSNALSVLRAAFAGMVARSSDAGYLWPTPILFCKVVG